jgi:hypothetical protein
LPSRPLLSIALLHGFYHLKWLIVSSDWSSRVIDRRAWLIVASDWSSRVIDRLKWLIVASDWSTLASLMQSNYSLHIRILSAERTSNSHRSSCASNFAIWISFVHGSRNRYNTEDTIARQL